MSPAKLGNKSENVQKSKGQKEEKKAPEAEAAVCMCVCACVCVDAAGGWDGWMGWVGVYHDVGPLCGIESGSRLQ